MIWKIIIIILCLLWWLPIVYMWHKTRWFKKYEDYLDNTEECLETEIRAYHLAVKDIQKEFDRLTTSLDEQRKSVNGWQHKIQIMDEQIRKLKKELSDLKE